MQNDIQTWPELAIGLYDKLTSRNAEITYAFDDVRVGVPRTSEPGAPQANWSVNGTVSVRTRNVETV